MTACLGRDLSEFGKAPADTDQATHAFAVFIGGKPSFPLGGGNPREAKLIENHRYTPMNTDKANGVFVPNSAYLDLTVADP